LLGLAEHARAVGHTLAPADPDGVVRGVPLFVRLGDRAVPALGLVLATMAGNTPADQIVIDRRGVTIGRSRRIAVDEGGRALVGVAVLASGSAVALLLSPSLLGVVLPAVPPLAAAVVAGAGALLWNQFGSAHRLRDLEGETTAIREALVRQESTVEALEEDLEAARGAVARSTGAEHEHLQAAEALRGELAEARAQEEQTRSRLRDLERELRAADPGRAELDDAEQERLRQRCAEVGIITRSPEVLARFRDL